MTRTIYGQRRRPVSCKCAISDAVDVELTLTRSNCRLRIKSSSNILWAQEPAGKNSLQIHRTGEEKLVSDMVWTWLSIVALLLILLTAVAASIWYWKR